MDPTEEREALIEAAWSVLARTGFDGLKVASILRSAKLSTNAFYRHFASKDALLLELYRDETARVASRLGSVVESAAGPTPGVLAWIATFTAPVRSATLRRRGRLFADLGSVLSGFPDEVAASRDLMLAPLVAALAKGCSNGDFAGDGDPDRDARAIYGLCSSYTREGIDSGSSLEGPDWVTSFALRALGVDPGTVNKK